MIANSKISYPILATLFGFEFCIVRYFIIYIILNLIYFCFNFSFNRRIKFISSPFWKITNLFFDKGGDYWTTKFWYFTQMLNVQSGALIQGSIFTSKTEIETYGTLRTSKNGFIASPMASRPFWISLNFFSIAPAASFKTETFCFFGIFHRG